MSGALREAAWRELQNPAPVGQRHAQIVRLARLLRAAGFSAAEIFRRLRANYDPVSLPDAEIYAVIKWAETKISTLGKRAFYRVNPGFEKWVQGAEKPNRDFHPTIESFLRGFCCGEPDLFDASPIQLPGSFRKDAELVFESLYLESEKLNIVTQYREEKNQTGNQKAFPIGFGKTVFRNEWIDFFRKASISESQAGAWFRINPVDGNGISVTVLTTLTWSDGSKSSRTRGNLRE
jgi:hypothetical protein